MKKLTFILSLTLLCLLATVCSKKEAVTPEKAERIVSGDGSSSTSSLKINQGQSYRKKTLVEVEFGVRINSFCLQGFGICDITIVNEKVGNIGPKFNGNRRALASEENGKFVLEFIGNHSHQQLTGPSFIVDADFVLPLSVTDQVGLQPGYTITQGSYPIISGPGTLKTVAL